MEAQIPVSFRIDQHVIYISDLHATAAVQAHQPDEFLYDMLFDPAVAVPVYMALWQAG